MKQNTIQDLRRFDEEIFDKVQEYINDKEIYSSDPFLIINAKTLELEIVNSVISQKIDAILISSLLTQEHDSRLEPNTDAIFELASKYILVR